MSRTIAFLLAGLVLGAGGTAIYLHWPGPEGRAGIVAAEAFETSLAAHDRIANETSPAELEAMIERNLADPASSAREAELEALLAQLGSVDPAAAVRLAQRLALERDTLARLYKAWADVDADAALRELGLLRPRGAQRDVALALLDVFGYDTAGIDRIASAFTPEEAMSFRADAIGRMAEHDLVGALAAASSAALPQPVRSVSLQRIAKTMARIDPDAAFEQAGSISIPLFRSRYLNQLMDDWASIVPAGALAYLETAELPEISMGPASFRALATASPEQLLALAAKLPPTTRTAAQTAALEALAVLDPVSAYQRLSTLPPSGDRDALIRGVADRYAAGNPEAALAWATTLEPRSRVAVDSVLTRIAADDPARVAGVVIAEILDPVAASSASDVPSLVSLLAEPLRAGSPELSRVADLLAANQDPRVRQQLGQLLQAWPGTDTLGAIEWMLRNPSSLSASAAVGFAQRVATAEPALARQTFQRVPQHLRAAWVEGAAAGLARSDFDAAIAWIEPYRGDPVYERALTAALAGGGAASNPAAAARLIDEDRGSRLTFAPLVVSAWANSDAAAAEQWVNTLPRGAEQDQGLAVLLRFSASRGDFDTGIFDRIGSPAVRQQALLSSLTSLGQRNPDLGRRLIAEHISDPEMRRQAELRLEAGARLPANLVLQ